MEKKIYSTDNIEKEICSAEEKNYMQMTFAYIKPDISNDKFKVNEILKIIKDKGFSILKKKKCQIKKDIVKTLFLKKKIKWDKERFKKYTDFIMSGPIIVLVLKKESAIKDFRKLMGDFPNPAENPDDSIRKKFGTCIVKNSIHGSKKNLETVMFEASHFFTKKELHDAFFKKEND